MAACLIFYRSRTTNCLKNVTKVVSQKLDEFPPSGGSKNAGFIRQVQRNYDCDPDPLFNSVQRRSERTSHLEVDVDLGAMPYPLTKEWFLSNGGEQVDIDSLRQSVHKDT